MIKIRINSKNNLPVVCLFLEHNMKKKKNTTFLFPAHQFVQKYQKYLRNSKLNDYQYR